MGTVRTAKRSGADALVSQLEAAGVSVAFGIPGVHNLAIFDALRRSSIRTVLVRHEQTCVYAADGYARATGRLAVALTTTGPGAANTAAAMGEARASRSPVLHISTQVESKVLEGRSGRFSLHESPHQRAILDPLSIWSASVARADAIPSLVTRATQEAFGGRRGPVFVDIPHDFLSEPVTRTAAPIAPNRALMPEPRALERAVEALRAAKRPVIWSGGGAIASEAGEALARVAELLDAPIVTTFAGKGIVPPDHPLLVGFPPHHPEVTKLIESSDAILIVGSDLDGMNTQGWRLAMPHPRVAINTISQDARRNYGCEVVVEADARTTLEAMAPLLPARSASAAKRVATVRAKADAAVRAQKDLAPGYRFIRTV
ncbi:MAG TPA: thiamine pyrophosphate-binding protein, partial [Actinomycetota bacterium]|nr:thiamine pyrophosphate-binding protein [Actinomycetota bacterium]